MIVNEEFGDFGLLVCQKKQSEEVILSSGKLMRITFHNFLTFDRIYNQQINRS